MPRNETVLSVFVASPSDVEEERDKLESVIQELNMIWARNLGVRLELIRWESHVSPGFGEDAQDVINEHIPDDYDLFIGIMWCRFGTPTKRAESGTIEEFQRAKERFDNNPDSLKLMLYFKDEPSPLPPYKIDYSQLEQVSKFRSSLGEEGGLYWSFNSLEDFAEKLRRHLSFYLQSQVKKNLDSTETELTLETPTETELPLENPTETKEIKDSLETGCEDESGILDLMEQFEDEFEALSGITERITTATQEVGDKMNARTNEINEFTSSPDSSNRKAAKRQIGKAATDMNQFVDRIETELPLFTKHLNAGMSALTQTAGMAIDLKDNDDNLEQVKENVNMVNRLCESMNYVEVQITAFKDSTAAIPRMTTTLNRSKRSMVNVLQKLIDILRSGQIMAKEAEASFALILEQS